MRKCTSARRIISIHAAREGGDAYSGGKDSDCIISIHAAREGGDEGFEFDFNLDFDISIHAAREGGDRCHREQRVSILISIHAAREGGDRAAKPAFKFLPISIHAAREGGDRRDTRKNQARLHFNPRRP